MGQGQLWHARRGRVMNLNEAMEAWGENAAEMEGGGPNLPYPSMVALTLSGAIEDPFSVGVLAILATSKYGPEEVPMDMAAAKCKAIDSQFYDEYSTAHGSRPKGAAVMEASWLATDRALYYVAPAIAGVRRWPWATLEVQPGRIGRRNAKFRLVTEQGTWNFKTGARAMPNLLACASWARAPHTS